jgi:hypothetical protein
LKHQASRRFWRCYRALPKPIRELADKNIELLKADHTHPSLHLKKIGDFWSIRIGLNYRALAIAVPIGLLWFWIGKHSDYERTVR